MIDHVKNIIDFELMLMVAGLTSMLWLIILKYSLHYEFLGAFKKIAAYLKLSSIQNASMQICVMCLTFWLAFSMFMLVDDLEFPARLSRSFMRGLVITPFILVLLKDQFNGTD